MGIITAILFLFNVNSYPQYKVGDCLIHESNNKKEFIKDNYMVHKILKIGKNNYLYKYGGNLNIIGEYRISYIDDAYIKVKCPEGF